MARRNKRGLQLTFANGQWRKVINGKCHYFGPGRGVSDKESYKEALRQYRIFVAKAEFRADAKMPYDRSRRVKATYAVFDALLGDGVLKEKVQEAIRESYNEWLKGIWEQYGVYFHDMGFPEEIIPKLVLSKGVDQLAKETPKAETGDTITIAGIVDCFLAEQNKRREHRNFIEAQKEEGKEIAEASGQGLSADRHRTIKDYSAKLKAFAGNRAWDGKEVTAAKLSEEWRSDAETKLHSGEIGANTFNERMKIMRQFLGFAHETNNLDSMPRNIKKLTAKLQYKGTAKAIPVETIRQLWGVADDREKAFMAQALNLGFYAKDISDLRHTEIIDGFIVRERGKTGAKACHKLWAVTASLIAKASNSDNRVFVGKNGETLVHHDSKHRVDLVARAWTSLCRRAGVKGYAFSNLRDTSATLVEKQFPALTDKFLSHVDNRIATFYIDNSGIDHRLDEVVDYLETVYDLK